MLKHRIMPAKTKRSATSAEKKHLGYVASCGCVICGSSCEIHHIIDHTTPKRSHFCVIGLCPYHHRTGGNGNAIHAGKKTWRENFGHERDYLGKEIT